MTDKEKILKKLTRRIDKYGFSSDYAAGKKTALMEFKSFVKCLPEEPKTDWLQELREKLDSLSKEDFEKLWAKYDKLNTMLDDSLSNETKESWNKRLGEEPVSEGLHTAAKEYANSITEKAGYRIQLRRAVVYGAKWQKKQMMRDAVEAAVTDIRTYKEENEVDFTIMLEKGIIPYELEQEVKLIIVDKED